MKVLKALGSVANGWLKFFVTLAAVGWFGFNALDRYTVPEQDVTPTEELVSGADLISDEASPTDVDEQVTFTSMVGNMNLTQMKDEVTGFAKNPNATVLFGLFSAFALGLVSRPGMDWFNKKRRLLAAKREQSVTSKTDNFWQRLRGKMKSVLPHSILAKQSVQQSVASLGATVVCTHD